MLPFRVMNTLEEIEKSADALSAEQQEALLRHLSQALARRPGLGSGWPVAPPEVPMEELRRIDAVIEAEFSQVDSPARPACR